MDVFAVEWRNEAPVEPGNDVMGQGIRFMLEPLDRLREVRAAVRLRFEQLMEVLGRLDIEGGHRREQIEKSLVSREQSHGRALGLSGGNDLEFRVATCS